MSDSFDDRLALALKSAVPEPPGEFDPLEIIREPDRRRSRLWAAPLAVGLLVAAVATGVVIARGGTGRAPHAGVGQRMSQLYGAWVLTDLRGMNGTAHTHPEYPAAFGFAADGNAHGACLATQGTITTETMTFNHGWPDLLVGDCLRLSTAQGAFVFGQVLNGTSRWRISDGELTIGRPTASIVLTRPQDLDNGQVRARLYQLAADVAGGRGIQIARATAAFAETESLASSVLPLVPPPYTGPMWVLQIRARQPFMCGECHSQIPGRRPQRFRYLYLFADLEARQFARAGLGGGAADLAKLGKIIRLGDNNGTSTDGECRLLVTLNQSTTYDLSQTPRTTVAKLHAQAPTQVIATASESCGRGAWVLSTDRGPIKQAPPGYWHIDRPGVLHLRYDVSLCASPLNGCLGGFTELRRATIRISS